MDRVKMDMTSNFYFRSTVKELTNSIFEALNWLQNVGRQAVRLHLLSYADKEITNLYLLLIG